MLKQTDLFISVNQIPPTGLKAKKEQVEDLLEGFRRQELSPAKEQELFKRSV